MRTRKSADHFDMLPFIAILMCTLGTLLLVTLSMAAVNLGPGAGEKGGYVVATGTPEELAGVPESVTGQYLKNILAGDKEYIPTPILP